ncbi:MAG: helix-turn-helix transcriptional regulator [Phaeodactylibacter sp.]|nr:helix-turn-helix transcriptional regulator [Phaeodactylibacter sp.]
MSADFGNRMTQARKEKRLSRDELGKSIGTSGPVIGRYERGDMTPSVEIATKIAEALDVSLDFLVGKSSLLVKDTTILKRLEAIAKLPEHKQTELFNVLDAYLRDFKTRETYVA